MSRARGSSLPGAPAGVALAGAHDVAPRRAALAGPAVAAVTLLVALVVVESAGVPLRDPDQVASGRLLVVCALVAALAGVDVVVRAARLGPGLLPTREALLTVRRERWTPGRIVPVVVAVVSFSLAYFAYRNLKSVVPLVRPDVLFDGHLASIDRDLGGGHAPGAILHTLLGTGVAAQALSSVYVLLFAFIPISLAIALVFAPDLETGLFYCTALSLNWLLAAGSYFLLPSVGPFHQEPGVFAHLPTTAVSELQHLLVHQRAAFVRDPAIPGSAQSIGAFASLHISVYVTAAVTTHLLHLRRAIRVLAWTLTAATAVSTVYFGWHYLLDDVAGVVIALLSLDLARRLAGYSLPGRP